MKRALLQILVCPKCNAALTLTVEEESEGEVARGLLQCPDCSAVYPVIKSVPRFVPESNYAANFGFQWNRFRATQLDSVVGNPISQTRLVTQSGWNPSELRGKRVLDVGCGAGRFVEVGLTFGAEVVAVDFSSAVDACWDNFKDHPKLSVVQADIYALPFRDDAFDFVYCFGVLQHTPDVRRAFLSLPRVVRPGGRLAVDMYPRTGLEFLWPKYWLRPVTKRVDNRRLFGVVQALTPPLLAVSRILGRIPRLGQKLKYLVPVANYENVYPLNAAQLREWAVLDTFDMLSPAHDQPQTADALREWFDEAGMTTVEVFRSGQLIGRAVKP